jgi:hypothetical protein
MKIDFRQCLAYEAWIISSDFGTPHSHRIYIRVLYPGTLDIAGAPAPRAQNLFANKHLKEDAATVLKKRNFLGATDDEKWDALASLNVRLNAYSVPANPPHTNTVIDFERIDKKLVAYKLAEALFKGMYAGMFGDCRKSDESAYVNHFEVDFGLPCVVSAGASTGVANKIRIGVRRISKLNSRNHVSFDVNHCAGTA